MAFSLTFNMLSSILDHFWSLQLVVVATVAAITVSLIFFLKPWKVSREKVISGQVRPTTPQPRSIDQDTRDEHTPDSLVPTQTSDTSRPQTVHSPGGGDEGDRDTWSGDGKSDTEVEELATVNHRLGGVRNENDHGFSTPTQVPPIASEQLSLVGGDGDVQGVGGDSDFPISTEAQPIGAIAIDSPSIPTESHVTGNRGECLQAGEARSMSTLKGASHFTISGNTHLYEIQGNAKINKLTDATEWKKDQLVTNLPRAQAGLNDYETKKKIEQCFQGTREALLREMMDWITDPGESKMYALSGLAGIGKSTVVYTIASQVDECGLLGASFFFSRDEADRRSAKKFFTTIAYQLCLFNEEFARVIRDALGTKRGSTATTGSPEEQLEALILDPLQAIVTPNTSQTLIVVDALDECDDEDAPSVLTGLCRLVQASPLFKVILTTRPQPLLDHVFAIHEGNKIFRMQDIEDKVVNDDIRLYLMHSLSQKQVRERLEDPEQTWYASDTQIEFLVQAAGKLFIIASLAVRFILDESALDPAGRIEELLCAFAQNHTPFDNLRDFYTIILRRVVPTATRLAERYQADWRDTHLVERYQAVVGTIILLPVPLAINTLAALTGITRKQVSVVLRQLQSIIMVDSNNIPIIYHQSFVDYITDSARCKDINLRIDQRIRHTWIATRCFEIMSKHLKYNILGLGVPARFMSNEDGLAKDGISDNKMQEMIPPVLQFTCTYWADHLNGADIEDSNLMNLLQEFANTHALHWFEVLSLIRKLDSAHRALHLVLERLKPKSFQLLSDGLRFISKFYQTIERSALHTYYSALSFTPADSLLYCRYVKEASYNVCDVDGVPKRWEALVANLYHNGVKYVQFSLDNTMLATWSDWSEKGELKIWNAAIGTPLSTITGESFAISNDFTTIASSTGDNIITLHNTDGSRQGATFATQAAIIQVAISSESSRIVGRLSGGTVCLWEIRTGELVASFEDYESTSFIGCLRFSAAGARLAYSSAIGIKLRDAFDGRFIADLDCGSSPLTKFSHDGSRIATLRSKTLKLWSCEDGKLVGVAKKAGYDLAISTNGSLLATIASRRVKLWSGNSGNPLLLVEAQDLDFNLYQIAFSSNDTLAIMTNSNIKLFDVNTRSCLSSFPFSGTLKSPLAFSADCTRLVARDFGITISLWDIQGIEASSPPSDQQASGKVIALALSRDCSRIVYGFEDGLVELWKIGGLEKQRIAAYKQHREQVTTVGFSPDGRQYASGSLDGTIKLWDGEDGVLRGNLRYATKSGALAAVEVSNSVLAAAGKSGLILWDAETLGRIYAFEGSFLAPSSFSANGMLLAVFQVSPYDDETDDELGSDDETASDDEFAFNDESGFDDELASNDESGSDDEFAFNDESGFDDELASNDNSGSDDELASNDDLDDLVPEQIVVFDVTKCTTIASFDVSDSGCQKVTFLQDNSHLVVQSYDGDLYKFNLANKEVTQRPTFEDIIQLPNISHWHGVPVWTDFEGGQYCLKALFSKHDDPVPLLWIPRELLVCKSIQERSIIAFCCEDGRVVLLRLPDSHLAPTA